MLRLVSSRTSRPAASLRVTPLMFAVLCCLCLAASRTALGARRPSAAPTMAPAAAESLHGVLRLREEVAPDHAAYLLQLERVEPPTAQWTHISTLARRSMAGGAFHHIPTAMDQTGQRFFAGLQIPDDSSDRGEEHILTYDDKHSQVSVTPTLNLPGPSLPGADWYLDELETLEYDPQSGALLAIVTEEDWQEQSQTGRTYIYLARISPATGAVARVGPVLSQWSPEQTQPYAFSRVSALDPRSGRFFALRTQDYQDTPIGPSLMTISSRTGAVTASPALGLDWGQPRVLQYEPTTGKLLGWSPEGELARYDPATGAASSLILADPDGKLPADNWDYAASDPSTQRLFLSDSGANYWPIVTVDLRSATVTGASSLPSWGVKALEFGGAEPFSVLAAKLSQPQIGASNRVGVLLYAKGRGKGTVSGSLTLSGKATSTFTVQVDFDASPPESAGWQRIASVEMPPPLTDWTLKGIIQAPDRVESAEMALSLTRFRPNANGYKFTNSPHSFKSSFDGVCLGMCREALKAYHKGKPIPKERRFAERGRLFRILRHSNDVGDVLNEKDLNGPPPRAISMTRESTDLWARILVGAPSIAIAWDGLAPLSHAIVVCGAFRCPDVLLDPAAPNDKVELWEFLTYDPNLGPKRYGYLAVEERASSPGFQPVIWHLFSSPPLDNEGKANGRFHRYRGDD